MKHPIIRLFVARLRALAAADRAAFPVPRLRGFMGPFARHMINITLDASGKITLADAGDDVARMFGRNIAGASLADLFVEQDRARIHALASAAIRERVACAFGAVAHHTKFRATHIEGVLTPEPRLDGEWRFASACVISYGFTYGKRAGALPLLTLTSERFVDLDGFVGRPDGLRLFARRVGRASGA
ncbi:MAG: PAS domain-containing protein [Beijerinckiaceae bacterium]